MLFKSVLDFFDGSIFSEEYLGDFAKIRELLDSEIKAAGDLKNPQEKAWLKLRQSILFMLMGNLKRAFDYLEEISLIENLPLNWSIRTAAYNLYYTSLRLYPAIIRFNPSLGGPAATFPTLELGFQEIVNDFQRTWRENLNANVPFFRFEAQIIQFLTQASLALWNNAYIQHPRYARGPWESYKETSLKNMAARANAYKSHSEHAIQAGMHQLYKYLLRLQAELEFGKSPGRSQLVESLKDRYRTSVDKHNLAVIKMLEADHILSPPFSNPIGLNLMLIEGSIPGESVAPWDSVEDQLKLGDLEISGQLYRQAYDLFADSGSPRGQAAIRLRQGCVEHIQALAADISPAEKSQRCELSRQHFAESLRFFGLDEANSQIVRGHQILLSITSGSNENLLAEATKIGVWGRASNNEGISRFVGILMQRFGRRQMLDYSRSNVALKCYKCAQACFNGLGDRFGLFRALDSELYLHYSMNDHLATRSMLNGQKEMFKELLQYFITMEKQYPSSATACYSLKQSMIIVSGNLILSAYQSVGDTEAHDEWKKYIKGHRRVNAGEDLSKYKWSLKEFDKYLFKSRDADDSPSILSNLPNFSSGDEEQHSGESSQPQISIWEYIQQGQDCVEKYYEASNKWSLDLRNLDVEKAESHLRRYIQETAPQNILIHPEAFFPVFAAADIGDYETSRQILRGMVNPKFLENDVKINQSNKPESKPPRTSEEMLQISFTLDNVIAACAMSQDWVMGHRILARIKRLYPEFLDITSASTSPSLWKRFAKVGIIYENSSAPLEAFATLLKSAQLAEQDRSFAGDPNSRRGVFDSNPLGDVFTGLARLCLRAGELGIPVQVLDMYPHNHLHAESWQEHALLFLEQAKARNLLEALTANSLNLGYTDERASRAQKRQLRIALQGLPNRSKAQEAELRALEASLREYESELDPLDTLLPVTDPEYRISAQSLYKAISDDELVIQVDYSLYGSTILGITSCGIEFAQQRPKRGLEMRRSVINAMKHLDKYGNDDDIDEEKSANSRISVEVYLKEISEELIRPLQHLILRKKHVIFITSQPLAAFPFSTLLLCEKPLFLQAAVSQAPSLITLFYLWKYRNDHMTSNGPRDVETTPLISVCSIAKTTKVLKAGKKTNTTSEAQQEMKLLYLAAIEAMVIARTFNSWPLQGTQIDRETLQSLIRNGTLPHSQGKNNNKSSSSNSSPSRADPQSQQTRILHIGAHGDYDADHPWLSYISLKERYRVLDIPSLQSYHPQENNKKTALIVFAACLSGMGRSTMGNDVLGFAHALLQWDCSAYLGALWHVKDWSSMLLMVFFYRHLWECVRANGLGTSTPSESRIAVLWQEAQKDVYNITIERAQEVISQLVGVLEGAKREGYDPEVFVKEWERKLGGLLKTIEAMKFDLKHPFHWGAFVVVGYGGMELGLSY